MILVISISVCFLILVINGQNSNSIDCNAKFGQTEIYFNPVNSSSEMVWIFDGTNDTGSVYVDSNYCYSEYCYYMEQYDYAGDDLTQTLTSPQGTISTMGYWDIHIIYMVAAIPEEPNPDPDLICSSSYIISDGNDFIFYPIEETSPAKPKKQIVTASLEEASNVEDLLIQFSQGSKATTESWGICVFDEIRICGTPITPAPTTNPIESMTTLTTAYKTMNHNRTEIVEETVDEGIGIRKANLSIMNVIIVSLLCYYVQYGI